MRTCGGCALCCSLVAVPELAKPAGVECAHGVPGGCGIFGLPTRPRACLAYRCAWLFNEAWPESLRPDRCHVVFEPFGDRCIAAAVDPAYPDDWRAGVARRAIDRLASAGFAVVVVVGNVKHVILPAGRTPSDVWTQVDAGLRSAWPPPPTPPI